MSSASRWESVSAPTQNVRGALVLVIDEDAATRHAVSALLRGDGHRSAAVASPAEARSILCERNLALVLFGLDGTTRERLDILEGAKLGRPDLLLIAMGEGEGLEASWRTRCRSAFDFVSRPVAFPGALRDSVRRALAHHEVVARLGRILAELSATVEGRAVAARCESKDGGAEHELQSLLEAAQRALRICSARVAAEPSCAAAAERHDAWRGEGAPPLSLGAYERIALARALDESHGDATAAARLLGIGRSTFYRKAARHGLLPPRTEPAPEPSGQRAPSVSGVGAPGAIG